MLDDKQLKKCLIINTSQVERMTDWNDAIIKSLRDLGGKATNQQIYEKIKDYVILNKDLLKVAFGNIKYHSTVRTHLTALKKKGIINSPRAGYHELAELK